MNAQLSTLSHSHRGLRRRKWRGVERSAVERSAAADVPHTRACRASLCTIAVRASLWVATWRRLCPCVSRGAPIERVSTWTSLHTHV
eukprot:1262967-Prymnesium_polylepis.1